MVAVVLVLAAGGTTAYALAGRGGGIHLHGGPMPRSAARACAGPVTAIRSTKQLNNARRLGQLIWISTVYDGAGPTKTVMVPISDGHAPLAVLRGWRCSDGAPLRFWFSGQEIPRPATAETGSKRLTVRIAFLRRNDYGISGYFMFWSAGRWVVEARDRGEALGTVVFDFPS